MKVTRMATWMVALAFVPAVLAPSALAQDSVSIDDTCNLGDALDPSDLSEQCADYIVDLAEFESVWGDTFSIAPLVKSSKGGSGFTGSLIGAQAISKDYLQNVNFQRSTYDLWSAPGFGVNADPLINDAGIPIVTSDLVGDQFAVAFSEFATADTINEVSGVVGAMVNRLPAEPDRLYVSRTAALRNGCALDEDSASFGFGSVDANGNTVARVDDFDLAGGACDPSITGNNILGANIAARDCGIHNVAGSPYGGGGAGNYDAGAASVYVGNSGQTFNTPALIPASVTGGAPVYIGSNFDSEYAHGAAGAVSADAPLSHLAGGAVDHRGNVSYHPANFLAGSTLGTAAILSRVTLDCTNDPLLECTDGINIWGLGAGGAVAGGPVALVLPRNGSNEVEITDNSTGFVSLGGKNEFGAYQSQVAFRGGNGQVALGVDQAGRLLAAAVVKHPEDNGSDWPINYIAVARVSADLATTEWTMAGYNNGTVGVAGSGKPILSGPGGSVIGRLVTLNNVTGGVPFGPSMSPPMIDSVGNIYFVSSLEVFNEDTTTNFNTGLIRAVYDPDTFSYELDLLLTLGGTADTIDTGFYIPEDVLGLNSDLNWDIAFMGVADSNSTTSGAPFSGNMTSVALMDMDASGLDTRDSRSLGGMVISVTVGYDSDENGIIDDCDNPFMPPSTDQDYNVVLYIEGREAAVTGCPNDELAECGDIAPDDGIRDDACSFYSCDAGVCSTTAKSTQADIGGGNGACPVDGTCDGNDRFHALNCFSNSNTTNNGSYPCADNPPAAVNVDAGGPAISCTLDGVCDGNDAFHALNCFSNINSAGMQPYPCSCSPQPSAPGVAQQPRLQTGVTLRAPKLVQPGELVEVDVYFDDAMKAVRGYQLHAGVTGGTRGSLELVDITVASNGIFAGQPAWNAYNVSQAQVVVGLDNPAGVPTRGNGYLATFVYRVPAEATGTFLVDLRYDGQAQNPVGRTFLFGENARPIDISSVSPASITVVDRRVRTKRLTAAD